MARDLERLADGLDERAARLRARARTEHGLTRVDYERVTASGSRSFDWLTVWHCTCGGVFVTNLPYSARHVTEDELAEHRRLIDESAS